MSAVREILARHGVLGGFRGRGHRLFGPCPVHGGDNPRAFVVDLRGDRWYCFTGCRRGGGPRGLAHALGLPPPDWTPPQPRKQRPFEPFTRRLRLGPQSDWLQGKGIEVATARSWDVGTWHGRGMLKGCVAVRLHDGAGYPLGYAGRRLDSGAAATRGKWVFPPRLPKSSLLYGLHRAHGKVVVVTECPWSVLRLAQIGVPGVGLLGVGISSGQQDLLQQFERVYAMMDGDPAGRIAARALAHRVGAHILDLPDGLDPDDLHDEELRGLLPFLK